MDITYSCFISVYIQFRTRDFYYFLHKTSRN
nr:MAG TPA: hypothetical protein [Caudoviricetes sp.]